MQNSFLHKTWVLWTLASLITLSSVIYQRMTGPSHSVRGSITIAGENIKYKLLTTHETTASAPIKIEISNPNIIGKVKYRRFKSHDDWTLSEMKYEDGLLTFLLPKLASAGKVEYQVFLSGLNETGKSLTEQSVILRYKDPVPLYFIIPHASIMFIAMLLATAAGIMAITGKPSDYKLSIYTTIGLLIGGLILGPIVQKYAFGAYWTGWPFGNDLTDNKTAFAFIFWLIALWRAKVEGRGRGWIVIASIVTLLVYLVPHSVLGSEIDYTKTNP